MIMVAAGLESAHPAAAPLAARIRAEGKRALTELRTMIGVLQQHETGRSGLRRLSELSDLLCAARQAGLDITTISSGRVAPLGEKAEHAAYRLIQEALTNAARHAPGAAIRVELTYRPGALDVEVRNGAPDRPGQAGTGGGKGLAGAGERIQAVGGVLEAGPYGDGYRVRAALPTSETGDYAE
jgi:signal transduction histidine kinase